jgi:phosphopantetheine--protein transferase-like protein
MVAVGVDLERVSRFQFLQGATGDAFYSRVYTAAEQRACGRSPSLLAQCFAVKEAVAKLLGTGLTIGAPDRVSCCDIEVSGVHDGNSCAVTLRGKADAVAGRLGISRIAVACTVLGDAVCALAGTAATGEERLQLQAVLQVSIAGVAAQLNSVNGRRDCLERRPRGLTSRVSIVTRA